MLTIIHDEWDADDTDCQGKTRMKTDFSAFEFCILHYLEYKNKRQSKDEINTLPFLLFKRKELRNLSKSLSFSIFQSLNFQSLNPTTYNATQFALFEK